MAEEMKLGNTTIQRGEDKEGNVTVSEDMFALAASINKLADVLELLRQKL